LKGGKNLERKKQKRTERPKLEYTVSVQTLSNMSPNKTEIAEGAAKHGHLSRIVFGANGIPWICLLRD
jgi:hypothetical protein